MKTPLGTEVDLGPGHIVQDGVPAPAKGAEQPLLFLAHVYCGHGRPSQLQLSLVRQQIDNAYISSYCRPGLSSALCVIVGMAYILS